MVISHVDLQEERLNYSQIYLITSFQTYSKVSEVILYCVDYGTSFLPGSAAPQGLIQCFQSVLPTSAVAVSPGREKLVL